jgi:S-adenosylmethionine synthetase
MSKTCANHFLFTSEAVSAGHPDKVADQISDAVLDAFLAQDKDSRVACEALVTTNMVVLAGEKRGKYTPNYDAIVRKVVADIGYKDALEAQFDAKTINVTNFIHEQAAEIAQGVDAGARKSEGAGDQGIMFGFAVAETPALMPAGLQYAHELLRALQGRRGEEPRLRPDAKSQLTLEYRDGKPVHVHTLLVSHQHGPDLGQEELREIVLAEARPIMGDWLTEKTRVLINPTGSFINGGPATDTGITGRKIIVDTYGGMAHHGGGAFSGKDPTKVDRSAAYAARYLAKNIVAAGLAYVCEIQLCYAIGMPEPLAIYVNTFGTAVKGVDEARLAAVLPKIIDLTPRGMRTHLGLDKPIYAATAGSCHFGREPGSLGPGTFSWEKVDLGNKLKALL